MSDSEANSCSAVSPEHVAPCPSLPLDSAAALGSTLGHGGAGGIDSGTNSEAEHCAGAGAAETVEPVAHEGAAEGDTHGADEEDQPESARDGDGAQAQDSPPDVTEAEDDAAGRSEAEADRLKAEGNAAFTAGDAEAALALYEEAIAVAPLRPALSSKRAAYHANRAACLLRLERLEECIAACDDCLDIEPRYVKALLRRVTALERLGMVDEALQDYEDILADFPGNATAKAGLARLEKAKAAKEEKLKEEMMGKLKDMGNSLLGHFGMSVDNFKFEKDPKTGGYSVNFQQGAHAAPGPSAGKDGDA